MAIPKVARVVDATFLNPDTRLFDLEMADGVPLGFIGGQYIIVDSKLVLPNGKAAKRAYSILSEDKDQSHLQLAVMRIPNGPGSGFMHGVTAGTELSFSGPWGKFFPPEEALGETLVLATDTGITAALGLLRSRRFEALLASAAFIWLRESPDYFLPEAFVRQRLPVHLRDVLTDYLPPIGNSERIGCARKILKEALARKRIERAFISGDGAVNYALLEDLNAAGICATKDNLESFFNMPKKSEALAGPSLDFLAAIESALNFPDVSVIVRSPSAIAEVRGPLKVRPGKEWLTLGEESGSHVHARLTDLRAIRFRQPPDGNAALEVVGDQESVLIRISFRGTNRSRPENFDSLRLSAIADRFAPFAGMANGTNA